MTSIYDVVIVGGGPAGLSAALALGRGRKRVLVCDSGPRRNAAATHIHNFVTRDGTPPDEFRAIGRQQLTKYPKVEVRDVPILSISGSRGEFRVALATETVVAWRVLVCTGMIDEALPLEGFRELWGKGIYQCPYCHGWEVQDRRWGYLALPSHPAHVLPFALMLRGWSRDVTVFTVDGFTLPPETRDPLVAAGIEIEANPVRLVGREHIEAVQLASGSSVACDVLFAHPPQRHVEVVRALDLALDGDGFVQTDPMKRETSVPGIYAAGDLTTRGQGALFAAAAGTMAATMINMELTAELAGRGEI